MASRQQQSLIASAIISIGMIALIWIRLASDLNSPTLFIIKVSYLQLVIAFIIFTILITLWFRTKLVVAIGFISTIILSIIIMPPLEDRVVPESTNSFSIATFSTLTRTNNNNDIVAFIEKHKPDLICLQEVSKTNVKELENKLSTHYQHHGRGGSNLSVFSRFPIEVKTDSGAYISTIVDIPRIGKTEVINSHMPRQYRSKKITDQWQGLVQTLGTRLTDQTIVCGDLNLTPYNTMYEIITNQLGYQDALSKGYGHTFPNAARKLAFLGPQIRIDYLLSYNLVSFNTRTLNASNSSDHRAVITEYIQK